MTDRPVVMYQPPRSIECTKSTTEPIRENFKKEVNMTVQTFKLSIFKNVLDTFYQITGSHIYSYLYMIIIAILSSNQPEC